MFSNEREFHSYQEAESCFRIKEYALVSVAFFVSGEPWGFFIGLIKPRYVACTTLTANKAQSCRPNLNRKEHYENKEIPSILYGYK
jgi:hypothetical protein